eukprot:TRINITY_DN2199_c0_g1_i8.p1 TRINITY_DN2199_c0_g1~~TRINITY_DN2199_c0_g1_i8.p1  ORF type:complete len:302 (-),score=76.19 TRINITY_DN2199_c0_g1_i8:58-963(-)
MGKKRETEQMIGFVNNTIKTRPCRHFEEKGTCTAGERCFFAHGAHELRAPTDPLPVKSFKFEEESLGKPKGSPSKDNRPVCRFFANGNCKHGDKCNFSHKGEVKKTRRGDEELENDTSTFKYSRVSSGLTLEEGTGNENLRQQLIYIIKSVQKYAKMDDLLSKKLKLARNMITSGKLQAASKLIYNMIYYNKNSNMLDRMTLQQILIDAANNKYVADERAFEDVDFEVKKDKENVKPATPARFKRKVESSQECREIHSALKKTLHNDLESITAATITEADELSGKRLNPFHFLKEIHNGVF